VLALFLVSVISTAPSDAKPKERATGTWSIWSWRLLCDC
jgi:hypothetical protein